jgi:transposase, IS5 family
MKPKKQEKEFTPDFFKQLLSDILDPDHRLVMLSHFLNWSKFDIEAVKYFPSETGKPATPSRLIAGLFYLKSLYGISDESLISHWVENPYWQHFCGEQYFQHELPIDPATLSKWRARIGKKGMEHLLTEVLRVAMDLGFLRKQDLLQVVADTTVQEKNITYPTDAKLYYQCREQLVILSRDLQIPLRQSYVRLGKRALFQVGRYGHAKQYRRMRAAIKKLKNYLGRVSRDMERYQIKHELKNQILIEKLAISDRLLRQQKHDKKKLYSLHAPEVECIAKGKVEKRYEFGVKVGFITTAKKGWVLCAEALHGNPYDGHTLNLCLTKAIANTNVVPNRCYADKGYRGHDVTETAVYISGQRRGVTPSIKRWMKRRSSIEPIIGHMKQSHLLGLNYLKGKVGDAINALCAAIGYNLKLILNQLSPG